MSNPVSFVTGSARHLGASAFLIGLLTILGAFGFQYIGGYIPCELCYQQRVPYYAGLPVILLTILAWPVLPRAARIIGLGIGAAIFLFGTYMGVYHAGVEWGLFQGPTACTGVGDGSSFDALSDLNAAAVVPCDRAQWRFLGLSFAGYNGLISLAVSALLIGGIVRVLRPAK
jgi:disulfide bond formation protein DsbB